MNKLCPLSIALLCIPAMAPAQSFATLTPRVREVVTIGDSVIALTDVTTIDGKIGRAHV